jgi:hypothetical protein
VEAKRRAPAVANLKLMIAKPRRNLRLHSLGNYSITEFRYQGSALNLVLESKDFSFDFQITHLPSHPLTKFLRVDAAHFDGMGHPADGQHIRRNAVVDVVRFREMYHVLKRFLQDEIELLVDC